MSLQTNWIATERCRRPEDYALVPETVPDPKFCPFCPGHEDKTPREILALRESALARVERERMTPRPDLGFDEGVEAVEQRARLEFDLEVHGWLLSSMCERIVPGAHRAPLAALPGSAACRRRADVTCSRNFGPPER
jgi:hypothetical protein